MHARSRPAALVAGLVIVSLALPAIAHPGRRSHARHGVDVAAVARR